MVLTVGKGEGAKVVQKRTSLKDRVAIERINKYRRAQGKKNLKGTKDESADLSPEDKAFLKSRGIENASPEVVARIKESEAAKGELGTKYVSRQGDRIYGIKEDTAPSRSVALRTSGINQVPGLQTNTGQVVNPADMQSREEVSYSQENSFVPVATEVTGRTLFSDKEGNTYKEVGSSEQGYIVSRDVKNYRDSQLELPDSKPVPTPFGFVELGENARRNIILKGENLQDTAEGKGLLGVERSPFGSYLRSAVGGNLVRFGKDPSGYLAKEVVIPASAAAGASIVAEKGISYIGSTVGKKVVGVGLGSVGVVSSVQAVSSRSASEQSPDILFAFVGGFRGTKDYNKVLGYEQSPPDGKLFSGSGDIAAVSKEVFGSKEGKVFIGGRGANKPSKTFIRKESYGQNYNPNRVQKGDEYLKVKSVNRQLGTKETRIYTQVRGKEGTVVQIKASMATMIEKGGVDLKVSRYQKPPTKYENTYFKTPEGKYNALVATKGGEKLYEQINFDESKSFKNINYKNYNKPRVENNFFIDKYYDNGVQKSVSKESIVQKQINTGNLPVPKTEKFYAKNIPFKDYPVDNNQVPQYELSPNEVVRRSPYMYNPIRSSPVRGGFRVRRSGQMVINPRPFPRKDNYDIVVVNEIPVPIYNAPVAPIISKNTNVPVPVYNKPVAPIISKNTNILSGVDSNAVSSKNDGLTGLATSDVGTDYSFKPVVDSGVSGKVSFVPVVDLRSDQAVDSDLLLDNAFVVDSVSVPVVSSKPRSSVSQVFVNDQSFVSDTVLDNRSIFKQDTVSKERLVVPVVPPVANYRSSSVNVDENSIIPKDKLFNNKEFNDTYDTGFRGGKKFGGNVDFDKGSGNGKYRVIVGKKGNKIYADLGVGGEELIKKGFSLVKNSAAASVRVIPLSRGAKVPYVASSNEFYSKGEDVFVQKASKRISSSGEKQDITFAPRKQRLTKGKNYNKALLLSKNGFSLRSIRRKFL